MSLLVWLPLNGNVKNQGLSNITFSNSDTSTIVSDVGKITANCYKRTSKTTNGLIKSTSTINLNNDFSMACWAYVIECVGDTANGLVSCHSHTDNTGCGITVKQVSTSDYRISCNTGTGSSRTYNTYYGTTNIKNKWCHLALTYNKTSKTLCLYVNGVNEYTLENYTNASKADYILLLDWSTTYSANTYKPAAKLNDVRIYDHCLSVKEIKELSKGLALHYKLSRGGENLVRYDSSLTAADTGTVSLITSDYPNAYSFKASGGNKRFYISTSNVWVTGTKYSYSFWAKASASVTIQPSRSIADFGSTHTLTTEWKYFTGVISSTATADGGTLSFTVNNTTSTITIAQIKLEKGTILTSWIPNKLDTLYSKLGYNSIEPDCSGYGNDGTITGSLIYSNETPRYEGSSYFDYAYNVKGNFSLSSLITISFWAKVSQFDTSGWVVLAGQSTGYYLDADSSSNTNWHSKATVSKYYRDGVLVASSNTMAQFISRDGNWHNYVYVCTLTDWTKIIVNGGSLWGSSWRAKVNISDFRIYATELSAADIKALYDTPISIDNNYNIHCMEVIE